MTLAKKKKTPVVIQVLPEFVLSGKGMKRPPFDVFGSLDSKTRSAVTRCYNAQAHKSQALAVALQAPKKAKKRKAPPKSVSMEVCAPLFCSSVCGVLWLLLLESLFVAGERVTDVCFVSSMSVACNLSVTPFFFFFFFAASIFLLLREICELWYLL